MDKEFVALDSYPGFLDLSINDQKTLRDATYNRAILLGEISTPVLTEVLKISKDSLRVVSQMTRSIGSQLSCTEGQDDTRFMPPIPEEARNKRLSFYDYVSATRPEGWTWVQYIVAGAQVNFCHLSATLVEVFKEKKHISECKDRGTILYSFEKRCKASGYPIEQAILFDQSEEDHKVSRRTDLGKPVDVINDIRKANILSRDLDKTGIPWSFIGHLDAENRFRLSLASIAKSWTSTRSAWNAYHEFHHTTCPYVSQFPISSSKLSSFTTIFRNADSCQKYLQHVKKGTLLTKRKWLSAEEESLIKRGANKAKIIRKKSFIDIDQTADFVDALIKAGEHELARFVTVAYTYQLRSQAEGLFIDITQNFSRKHLSSDDWHGLVKIYRKKVDIILRTRKNKQHVSRISRRCQCHVNRLVCGACAIRYQLRLSKAKGSTRLFNIKYSDIRKLQDIAKRKCWAYPTWHGFRRGRTTDLVSGRVKPEGFQVSLEDIFESGGWQTGSRSILRYLKAEVVDKEALVSSLAEESDSE